MLFEFKGTITMDGVYFIVEADSLEEAKQKMKDNDWVEIDDGGAEMSDWEIIPSSGKACR